MSWGPDPELEEMRRALRGEPLTWGEVAYIVVLVGCCILGLWFFSK